MQWIKSQLKYSTSHCRAISSPSYFTLIQLPTNASWEAAEDGLSSPTIHVGDSNEILSYQLQPGLALVIVGIWGANQ